MVADENTRFRGVKPGRAAHLELHARDPENVAEEGALQPVAFARINDNSEKQHEDAEDCKMNSAEHPQNRRSDCQVSVLHTIASRAAGRISTDWHSRRMISPSIITFVGPSSARSMRRADARVARESWMCVPVKR